MEYSVSINILKENDEILCMYNLNDTLNIAVKHGDGKVDIFIIGFDKDNLPRISGKWEIGKGNEEIVVNKKNSSIKVTTF